MLRVSPEDLSVYLGQVFKPQNGSVTIRRTTVKWRTVPSTVGTSTVLFQRVAAAIGKCSKIWASLPGNDYDQGGKTLTMLLEYYATLV